jgi:hypothetical protein
MPPHRIAASARPNASKSRRAKPPLLPPRLVPPPHHAHATRPNRPRRSCVPSPPRLSPRQNLHSARGTASAPITRFRALALFGRRPQERVDRPSSRRPKTCTQPAASRCTKLIEASRSNPLPSWDMRLISSAQGHSISGRGRVTIMRICAQAVRCYRCRLTRLCIMVAYRYDCAIHVRSVGITAQQMRTAESDHRIRR